MDKLVINIKDHNKMQFLLDLLSQFDFIEIPGYSKDKRVSKSHNLFDSAGIWANRDIDGTAIRRKAWTRKA